MQVNIKRLRGVWKLINIFNLRFQILDLLQKLVVLLHQLIVAFCLGLFKLQTQEVNAHVVSHTHTRRDSPASTHPFYVLDNFIDVRFINLNLLPEKTRFRSLAGVFPCC